MTVLPGRILEVWREADQTHIILIAGTIRHLLTLQPGLPTPRIGMLVRAEVSLDRTVTKLATFADPQQSAWEPDGDVLRWRRASSRTARLDILAQRQKILRLIRDDLYEQGFLEVQTPLLVPSTCPDLHIDSISAGVGYLVTSTEYQLKRLLVGGVDKIFSLTQNFRAGDVGRYHNPEFTMLEWARTFAPLAVIEADVERFTRSAFNHLHPSAGTLEYDAHKVDLTAPWERITVREALERYLGVRVAADFSLASLLQGAASAGVSIPENFREDAHALITYLLDLAQPHLGTKVPTFLQGWPAFMTSSAALDPENPALAARSELFIAGIEIADGFPSLRDAELQHELFAREQSRRGAEGKPTVTLDQRYLAALQQGIPPGAGMALGIDRLVMVLTGCQHIREVLTFAWDER